MAPITLDLGRVKMLVGVTGSDDVDWRCNCCKRHTSELKPFDKAGNLFDGALLMKIFRPALPHNEFVDKIYDEFFRNCPPEKDFQKAEEKLVQRYGAKKANFIIDYAMGSGCIGSSWECRDCIVLDGYEFDERRLDSWAPPEKCDCCGRHLGELSPFTEGDPVMDYFKGKRLARRYRPDAPPTGELNKMIDEFFGNCITYEDHQEALENFIQKYGEEKALELWTFAFVLDDLFKKSWECKDCIALDTHQYFEKKIAQKSDSGPDSSG